jgi:hypothetical protein
MMGAKGVSWAGCVGLVTFAALTVVGVFAEAAGAGAELGARAELFASITALECLVLIAVLRPASFTHLDGGRALLAFALSVPWSAVHLVEHMDVAAGFGARVVWLLIAQAILVIIAAACWAHCRWGRVDAAALTAAVAIEVDADHRRQALGRR